MRGVKSSAEIFEEGSGDGGGGGRGNGNGNGNGNEGGYEEVEDLKSS